MFGESGLKFVTFFLSRVGFFQAENPVCHVLAPASSSDIAVPPGVADKDDGDPVASEFEQPRGNLFPRVAFVFV